MNNKIDDNNSIDYIKTFAITLFIVVMFGFVNVFYMIHNIFNESSTKKCNVDDAFEYYLVDVLIDKNNDIAKMNPKNYAVNMRLGILYSYKKNFTEAEKEFKNAIEKSVGYDFVPNYQLAKLYIRTNRLKEAQQIIDVISERPNKKLIKLKGEIYSDLGEAFYKQGYYAISVLKYEKALSYYEIINTKDFKSTKIAYETSCLALADEYVKVNKIDEAIMSLEKAYAVEPENVMVNYKLGLLYIDNNPKKAYDLLSFVNKKSPQTINYEILYSLINKLADISTNEGKYTDADLYHKRAEQYKKFVKNNLLYENDLYLDLMRLDISNDLAAEEFLVNLQFRLENNSSLDINNLYVKVLFKDGNKIIQDFNQKLYDDIRNFKAGTITPPIVVSASSVYKKNKNYKDDDIIVEIYAYKYPKYSVKLAEKVLKKPSI